MNIVLECMRITNPGDARPERWERGEVISVRQVGYLWNDKPWASGNPVPVSIVRVPGVATVLGHTAHGKSVGDLVVIQGADQERYNGVHVITEVTQDTYSYALPLGTPPASGRTTADTCADPCATDPALLTCGQKRKFFCVVTDFPDRKIKRVRASLTQPWLADGDPDNADKANFLGRREWVLDVPAFPAPIRRDINNPPHSIVRSWAQIKNNMSGHFAGRKIGDGDVPDDA